MDCYDLKACPSECPEGGWAECSANPEADPTRRRRRAMARAALACLAGMLLVALLAAVR